MTDKCLRGSGLDLAWPAHHEWDSRSALKSAVLAAAKRAGGFVAAQLLDGVVAITVIHDRAVVAGEDDQRVRGKPVFVEGAQHLADRPVELDDRVASRAHPALAREARVRHARDVDVVGCEVEEEWSGFVPVDESDRLAREGLGHGFIVPEGGFASVHEADAADTVHDRHVVAVAGMEMQQIRIGLARRDAGEGLVVTDFDRVGRVEADDAMVSGCRRTGRGRRWRP